MHIFSPHQQKQIEVIDQIEQQIQSNSLTVSTVDPVEDFEKDARICLTSVHIPHEELISKIQNDVIQPLRLVSQEHYYYPPDSIHMTIKNIRVINNPPHFTKKDIEKSKKIFAQTIPNHKKFTVYFYRLLLFPLNLALIGTTDPQLDSIILDLDKKLKDAGTPDDKNYINDRYFFSNITLARFRKPITKLFRNRVQELSSALSFEPYIVDSVSLVTANAVFKKRNVIMTWELG